MIYSLGIILLLGFSVGYLLDKIKIPGLFGMIIVGLLVGPYCLNFLDSSILNISSELRQIALVIILTRSGLNLDIESLKKVGRSAILMCFIPATFEIIGVTLASYFLLNLSVIEGMLLGSVLAAVSPAVVSPRMIKCIEERYGEDKGVAKLVLAGSSVDDIYVVVLFYSFLGLNQTSEFNAWGIAQIPISIILGIILGIVSGLVVNLLFKHLKFNIILKTILTLSLSFLFIGLEKLVKDYISISSLLGVMVMAMTILFKNKDHAKELSTSYNVLWKVFEIILFVLVGASLNFTYLLDYALMGLLVIVIGLLFRVFGVYLCLLGTNLNFKERLFCIIAYLPKATVQASIGGIALSVGLGCGEVVLGIAVLSILISAPIGAILIDNLYKKLLVKSVDEVIEN